MVQRRFFPDQSLSPGTELKPEDLSLRSAYVAAVHDHADAPGRLEIVVEGQIRQVVYHGAHIPEDLFKVHHEEYPASGMIIKMLQGPADGGEIEETSRYSAQGELLEIIREYHKNSVITLVEYRDGEGKLFRKDVFEYKNGQLLQVQVLDADGKLLHVQVY
ncbi:hypothetical protein V8G57_24575 [Collimonas sp. H4R21]|uniref:Nuclear transport factor 2 family protein n=1 Tax=Collimonas rhizosphaerae TaxID=3126357 RepID=A0ABU9Q2U5_9BURK